MKPRLLISVAALCLALSARAQGSDVPESVSLSFGYVSKQWSTKLDGYTKHENLWGEEGKRLHGAQVGLAYQPHPERWAGIYTGAFLEIFLSLDRQGMGYDEFTETGLYVPLHARLALPLGNRIYLTAHGGLGLNFVFHGGFTNRDAYYIEWEYDPVLDCMTPERHSYELDHVRYGKEPWPKRYNASLEWSAGIRINRVVISGGYSYGLINHRLYKHAPGLDTRQDKLTLSLNVLF